jgi:hypothetical protein
MLRNPDTTTGSRVQTLRANAKPTTHMMAMTTTKMERATMAMAPLAAAAARDSHRRCKRTTSDFVATNLN